MAVGAAPVKKGPISYNHSPLLPRLCAALNSTIGSKYLVAVTGLILVGFLFGHLLGNLLIFKGKDALNSYAQKLRDMGALLWVARIGLLVVLAIHIRMAVRLNLRNRAARPTPYRFKDTVQATLASRTMVLTGLVILAFVIYHLAHFTFHFVQSTPQGHSFSTLHEPYWDNGVVKERHDVHAMVIAGFSNAWVVSAYVVAQLFLGMHLSHGIASTMQTLGWSSPRTWPVIRCVGWAATAIIVLGNISIPTAVLLGLVR